MHRDINGNQTRYFHDGTLKFMNENQVVSTLNVSYHSEWIELYSSMKSIMDGINQNWFDQIQWTGFM